ncbi:MAG TPA: MBL fold metallo-hydrolase [Stellaceae bacterium]|nr:MBL fold metallo-hydrolase [Stellaceae bacterium]
MTTTIDEIADGIYRIFTPVEVPGAGGFSFNQYLILDEAPLLFHTGLRGTFAAVREAIARVMPPERLRYVALSHFEADECGALNDFLALAPVAEPVCGQIAAMVSIGDYADRPPRALADGETLALGRRSVRWLDAAHVPHGWECGFMMEAATGTLLCGDLFTQPGSSHPPLTEADILGPSEAFRHQLDYYAHAKDTRAKLEKLAGLGPTTLACMHGSAWRGDGAALLRELADSIERG